MSFDSFFRPLYPCCTCVGCIVVQYSNARTFGHTEHTLGLKNFRLSMNSISINAGKEACVGIDWFGREMHFFHQPQYPAIFSFAPFIAFGLSPRFLFGVLLSLGLHWMLMKMNLDINCNNGTVDFSLNSSYLLHHSTEASKTHKICEHKTHTWKCRRARQLLCVRQRGRMEVCSSAF